MKIRLRCPLICLCRDFALESVRQQRNGVQNDMFSGIQFCCAISSMIFIGMTNTSRGKEGFVLPAKAKRCADKCFDVSSREDLANGRCVSFQPTRLASKLLILELCNMRSRVEMNPSMSLCLYILFRSPRLSGCRETFRKHFAAGLR